MTKLQEALETIGGLSKTSKMPWYSYSIPAQRCKVGSKLASVKGTVCNGCYALKGYYRFTKVHAALEKRYQKLMNTNREKFVEAFVLVLETKYNNQKGVKEDRFRWHDSGDVQSYEHLEMICEIARKTPFLRHWLPTKEYTLISMFPSELIPSNLQIKVSHPKIGVTFAKGTYSGYDISTVGYEGDDVAQCNAQHQDGECRECDACWKPGAVNYPLH